MAQQTTSFTDLKIGMPWIGLDRWWWQTLFLHLRFTIKDPSELETGYLPPTPLNVIHKSQGGSTIRDVRCAMRNDLAVESVLRQVSA